MSKYIFLLGMIAFSLNGFGQKKIVVRFENMANGRKIYLNEDWYDEDYNISKLKYYISNINLVTQSKKKSRRNIYLIDASKNDSIVMKQDAGKVIGIRFLIGIDSALNYSGAQSGALDPLNDMFWTWNNGYVVFKLEGEYKKGHSTRLEYHIGGYKGENKTSRIIFLPIEKIDGSITIQMNIDKFWNDIKMNETPIITSPGTLAKKAADNFTKMFSIKN
jgi:hypothetical protein